MLVLLFAYLIGLPLTPVEIYNNQKQLKPMKSAINAATQDVTSFLSLENIDYSISYNSSCLNDRIKTKRTDCNASAVIMYHQTGGGEDHLRKIVAGFKKYGWTGPDASYFDTTFKDYFVDSKIPESIHSEQYLPTYFRNIDDTRVSSKLRIYSSMDGNKIFKTKTTEINEAREALEQNNFWIDIHLFSNELI